MLLVVDMNILFSFFRRSSFTRELLTNPNLKLCSPAYALDELNKHLDELMSKAKISIGTFELYKTLLSWFVEFVPLSGYRDFRNEAESICPDPDDTQYFALALKLSCPIWSKDKRLKEQSSVKVFTTAELIKEIGL